MPAKRLGMFHVHGSTLEMIMQTMARETFGNVPRPRFNFGNDHADNGPRTRLAPQADARLRAEQQAHLVQAQQFHHHHPAAYTFGHPSSRVDLVHLDPTSGLLYPAGIPPNGNMAAVASNYYRVT
ncbi:unnamed protein product [Protopolystoma xenopodis]|uniref:Uncharacterized protein n=1 Tax=Protopolystoma xenopodis TaxID=117903 RepID=A0A448WS22_9PLAT|nr:unnamed protein product [Protopolystoma xenopodis]